METLFEYLADGRPERLVHNSLLYGLANDVALAGWLAKVLGMELGNEPIPFHIESEKVDEDSAWRTDITLKSKAKPENLYRIELKLNAAPTRRQIEAAKGQRVDLVICPRGKEPQVKYDFGEHARVLTWHEVANAFSTELPTSCAIRTLLEQADSAHGTFVDELNPEDALNELAKMMNRAADERHWPKVYWFLYSIDYVMRLLITREFDYIWSRTVLSTTYKYYGWSFNIINNSDGPVMNKLWWLGFVGNETKAALELWYGNEHKVLRWAVDESFPRATEVAKAVVNRCKTPPSATD